ncbi:pickpocket protein 11 [Hylaeus anthracinus]|uniref:pickpocket protein 11 n=1 Tax=Hylaeus anthracinus TaxID=313031 RepID=UPI0023B8BDF8|nr:pickpocket protein 11 [Hylaeus anthracinus]
MSKRLIWWWKIIKHYLMNCSIHGVRYLVDGQLSYLERFFWLISCVLCWYGCALMIRDVIIKYIEYPVAVTVETMYVDWKTPFPAVVFCIANAKTITNNYFKKDVGLLSNYSNRKLLSATTEELLSAYDEMRIPCTELLDYCEWNRMTFNCCNEFHELRKSGVGHCIAMNTFHLSKVGEPGVRFFVNRTVQNGDLTINIKSMSKSITRVFSIHVFPNLGLPTSSNTENKGMLVKVGKVARFDFTMFDTFNEDGVRAVAIQRRNCRFSEETQENSMFEIYSSDSCNLEVVIERMIQLCGCVHFYYSVPRGARVCNGTEMQCIIENKPNILSQEMHERCLQNCDGTSLLINRWEEAETMEEGLAYSRVHFKLLSKPTKRYRRYVANDLLDVTVSVGSALGLFMGMSILSIFEIPYLLFIRRDEIT